MKQIGFICKYGSLRVVTLSIQVLSTLKVGAEALKQNQVSLTEVDDIMDQLEEVVNV